MQHGRQGEDVIARVPPGTLVYDAAGGKFLADLRNSGDELVAAHGGHGGLGNARFATSVNQAPRGTIPATPGETRRLRLELRLLADVGLVGKPNAGKSTLLARVSAARPKVGDYPFTTLVPQLGVVRCGNDHSFVMADVPGLIRGAHEGHGLGDRFLRHLTRTRLLIHLLDLCEEDPVAELDEIENELRQFDPELAGKPRLVVGNKLDLTNAREREETVRARLGERGLEMFMISAVSGEGIDTLLAIVCRRLGEAR